jgi:hypothetical protein
MNVPQRGRLRCARLPIPMARPVIPIEPIPIEVGRLFRVVSAGVAERPLVGKGSGEMPSSTRGNRYLLISGP